MNEHRQRLSNGLARPLGLGLSVLLTVASAACGDDTGTAGPGTTGPGSGGAGGGGPTTTTTTTSAGGGGGSGPGGITVEVAATDSAGAPSDFSRPFDATPSPNGSVFYFTGYDPAGDAGVFSRNADGTGAITTLHAGSPLAGPFGLAVSTDGTQLFIADTAAVLDPTDDDDSTRGLLFTIPTSGGAPTALAATAGYEPRGLEVGDPGTGETTVFSGKDPSGVPGVFSVAGGVTTIVSGSPFIDPSGVAIAADGRIFVADTQGGAGGARVYVVDNGTPTLFASNLTVGYPVGLALTMDDSQLLVSGVDPDTTTSLVYLVDIATMTITNFTDTIDANDDSGGLHRAKGTDTFAWCGNSGSAAGTGTVYRITVN